MEGDPREGQALIQAYVAPRNRPFDPAMSLYSKSRLLLSLMDE